jgi:hypothetical protein
LLALALGAVGHAPGRVAGQGSPPAATPPSSDARGDDAAGEAWLVDGQGRHYRIDRLPKSFPHQRLEGNRLRTVWGITVDLAGEEDDAFLVKIYRTAGGTGPPAPRGASDEEKARVAATYRFDLAASDRMRFEPFDEGLPRSLQWRHGFALADMNGDGKLDIVHGPPRKRPGPPVIFLGDGAGHWRRWREAAFPAQAYDYGNVAVADFNADGYLDVALGMHLLGVTVLLGDGAGRFTASAQGMDPIGPRQAAFASRALAALDWDGDGRVDVLALGEGPRLELRRNPATGAMTSASSTGMVLYRNRGAATWEKRTGTQKGGLFADALAVGRLGPGGRPGLVAASSARGRDDLLFLPGDPFTVTPLPGVRPGALVRALAVADFDGDDHDDVAIGYAAYEGDRWRSGIDVVLMRPGGTAERRAVYAEDGAQGVSALGAGDLDGDRRPDLVALTAHGETMVLLDAGGGTFTREAAQLTQRIPGCHGYHVEVRDLDGDGLADIVAAFAGESEGMALASTPGCPGEGSLRAWRSRRS